MADEKKTFTEDEHLAILADRVSKETAALTAENDQLKSAKTEVETKLDVTDAGRLAAEQRAEKAEQDLADYKAQQESEREAAARKDERVAKVREAAKHLDDAWFTEGRVARITAMSDEDFTGYVSDLVDSLPPADGKQREIPRETAMKGNPVDDGKPKTGAGRGFLMRNYENQEA